jgi:hypothetical protein
MATVNSTRELHTELDAVCSALEALFDLASAEHSRIEAAALPAMLRFRQLLDASDSIAGADLQH